MLARAARLLPGGRLVLASALALSAASVLLVSGLRLGRYLAAPGAFLARETQNFEDIAFLNERLDPAKDRVATTFKASFLLRVPWLNLDPAYQAEIAADGGRARLLAAGDDETAVVGRHSTHEHLPHATGAADDADLERRRLGG